MKGLSESQLRAVIRSQIEEEYLVEQVLSEAGLADLLTKERLAKLASTPMGRKGLALLLGALATMVTKIPAVGKPAAAALTAAAGSLVAMSDETAKEIFQFIGVDPDAEPAPRAKKEQEQAEAPKGPTPKDTFGRTRGTAGTKPSADIVWPKWINPKSRKALKPAHVERLKDAYLELPIEKQKRRPSLSDVLSAEVGRSYKSSQKV